MSDQDIAFNLDVPIGNAGKSLQDLKKEFKEVQKELSNTVQGTKEYQKTLEKLGSVKDEIGDLRNTIDALNPEGKVAAFAKVGSTIASGFAAAQGAAALFGSESEELQKTMLKVQAAMALSEGIKGIVGAADAFEVLNAVVKANPILAIVAGFTALAAISTVVYNEFFKLDSASESLSKKLAKVDEENKHINASLKAQITALSGLKGNEDEILALKEKGFKLDIERQKLALQVAIAKQMEAEASATLEEQLLRATGSEKAADILKFARMKEQRDATRDAIETLKQSIAGLAEFHNIQEQKKIDVSTEATKKEIDLAKKKADEQKKYLDEQYAYHKKIQDQIAADLSRQALEDRKKLEEKKEEEQILNDEETATFLNIAETKKKRKEEDAAADQKLTEETEAAKSQSVQKGLQAAQALTDLFFGYQLKQAKGNADKEREIRKKQFNVNKAFGIANAVVDGIGAVQKALNNPYPLNIILAVLTGVIAAANIVKIGSSKFDDGGGSGGGGGDVGGGGIGASAPVIPSPNNTSTKLNDDGTKTDKVGQPIIIKNEIVETQVTENQSRVSKIKESATYG
jgi:hypothetical protein